MLSNTTFITKFSYIWDFKAKDNIEAKPTALK